MALIGEFGSVMIWALMPFVLILIIEGGSEISDFFGGIFKSISEARDKKRRYKDKIRKEKREYKENMIKNKIELKRLELLEKSNNISSI